MNKNNITLSYKQVGVIVLVLSNLLVIGPGSWFLTTLWTDARAFKNKTAENIENLQNELGTFKINVSTTYLPRQLFNDYRDQMMENIRYLDSKVSLINACRGRKGS